MEKNESLDIAYSSAPLVKIDKKHLFLVLSVTVIASLALWEYPLHFLGLTGAVIFLAAVYNIPELGVGVFVNGLFLLGYFWRGFGITHLVTPLALVICVAGLAHYAWNNGLNWRFGVLPATALFVGIMLFVGIVYSPLPGEGVEKAGRYLSMNLFIFFATMIFTGRPDKLRNLLAVIAVSGFVLAGISLVYITLLGIENVTRFTLPGQNPIWLARGLGMSILATLFLLELTRRIEVKLVLVVFVLVMAFSMYVAASRGPLIALAVALLFYFLVLQRKRLSAAWKLLSLFTVVVAFRLFILITPGEIWGRMVGLFSGFDLTAFYRIQAFERAKELFLDNPLKGVGTGGFGHFAFLTYPHNIFLELASELGILGVGALCIMILYTTHLGTRLLRSESASCPESSLSKILFAIFVFSLVNSQFSGEISGNYELWFAAAAIWSLYCSLKIRYRK